MSNTAVDWIPATIGDSGYYPPYSLPPLTPQVGTFDNVIGGAGAMQSANYVTGATGWTINGDGSAEFNNVTVRGTLIAGKIDIPDTTTAASFHVDTAGNMWIGANAANFATAPFKVTNAGALTATSAAIRGTIDTPDTTTAASFHVDGTGHLWVGANASNFATAPFRVANDGTGAWVSSGASFVIDATKVRLTATTWGGFLEANSTQVRVVDSGGISGLRVDSAGQGPTLTWDDNLSHGTIVRALETNTSDRVSLYHAPFGGSSPFGGIFSLGHNLTSGTGCTLNGVPANSGTEQIQFGPSITSNEFAITSFVPSNGQRVVPPIFSIGGSHSASPPSVATGPFSMQFGTNVLTSNAFGGLFLTIGTFRTGLLAFGGVNGDDSINGGKIILNANLGAISPGQLSWVARDPTTGGTVNNTTMRVDWWAIGW